MGKLIGNDFEAFEKLFSKYGVETWIIDRVKTDFFFVYTDPKDRIKVLNALHGNVPAPIGYDWKDINERPKNINV